VSCTNDDCPCWMHPDGPDGVFHQWMTYWESLDDEGKRIELGMMDTYDESENP
jgi:hypothetical protein